MLAIAPDRRLALTGLFTGHIGLRTLIDAMLQGRCGEARANSVDDPRVASLTLGVFTFIGGDATHPAANELIEGFDGFRAIMVADRAWRDKVMGWENAKTSVAERFAFSCDRLDRTHLQALAARVPDGFEIRALDRELTERLQAEVHAHLIPDALWDSPADFAARGFGFCALRAGRLVAGITSAVRSDEAVEIQINTHPDCQGKGLATVLGATFILDSLDRGLEPHWDTGSSISYRVAEKLGYREIGAYEVLEWEPPAQAGSSGS